MVLVAGLTVVYTLLSIAFMPELDPPAKLLMQHIIIRAVGFQCVLVLMVLLIRRIWGEE